MVCGQPKVPIFEAGESMAGGGGGKSVTWHLLNIVIRSPGDKKFPVTAFFKDYGKQPDLRLGDDSDGRQKQARFSVLIRRFRVSC